MLFLDLNLYYVQKNLMQLSASDTSFHSTDFKNKSSLGMRIDRGYDINKLHQDSARLVEHPAKGEKIQPLLQASTND